MPAADTLSVAEAPADEAAGVRSRGPSFRAIRQLLEDERPVTWVFTGDGQAGGAEHTQGRRSFVEHFAERIRWELRRLGDVVINTGASAGGAQELLENLDWRVLRFQPDVVSLVLGLQDATAGPAGRAAFRRALERLIERLRSAGAIPLLTTPNYIRFRKAPLHADVRAYVRIIRETARKFEAPCIDHWAHWKQSKPRQADLQVWLASDGLHPGVYGHRELARLMFVRLGIYDETSPTCRPRVT